MTLAATCSETVNWLSTDEAQIFLRRILSETLFWQSCVRIWVSRVYVSNVAWRNWSFCRDTEVHKSHGPGILRILRTRSY